MNVFSCIICTTVKRKERDEKKEEDRKGGGRMKRGKRKNSKGKQTSSIQRQHSWFNCSLVFLRPTVHTSLAHE